MIVARMLIKIALAVVFVVGLVNSVNNFKNGLDQSYADVIMIVLPLILNRITIGVKSNYE